MQEEMPSDTTQSAHTTCLRGAELKTEGSDSNKLYLQVSREIMLFRHQPHVQMQKLTSAGVEGLGSSRSGDTALGNGAKTCTPKSAKTCFLGFTKDCRGRGGVRFSLCCPAVLPADCAPALTALVGSVVCLKGFLQEPFLPGRDLQYAGMCEGCLWDYGGCETLILRWAITLLGKHDYWCAHAMGGTACSLKSIAATVC